MIIFKGKFLFFTTVYLIVLACIPIGQHDIALTTMIVKTVDTSAPLETPLQQTPMGPKKYKLSTMKLLSSALY